MTPFLRLPRLALPFVATLFLAPALLAQAPDATPKDPDPTPRPTGAPNGKTPPMAAEPPPPVAPRSEKAEKPKNLSLVRVNVTGQAHDYFRPWQKKAPFSKRALGAVLAKGRILVTADLVANHNYVELERAETGDKTAATVDVVDYEANLALLKTEDPKFLEGIVPLELTLDTVVGDRLTAWQLEPTGSLVGTEGLVTTVQMSRYPADVGEFLIYRLSLAMQYRDNSYTVPLVKNNRLAGLLLRYDPRSQTLDAIPAPVIAHFLKGAEARDGYRSFPSIGFDYFSTRDPQLRAFAGQTGKAAGVYITTVTPESGSSEAGLQEGDVLLEVADKAIDQNGNYVDPLYGKVEFTNLIKRAFTGDTLPLKVLRGGKPLTLSVTLRHRDPQDYVVPPYGLDTAPSYYVLGGFIFQELSRQYLREWGANYQKEAPQRFVYLDRFQSELFPEGDRRIVILSQILPSNLTIGYEDNSYLVVTKVNGREIKSLRDLAEAAKTPVNGFAVIETEEDPKQLQLDMNEVTKETTALQKNYGLPAMARLEEPTPRLPRRLRPQPRLLPRPRLHRHLHLRPHRPRRPRRPDSGLAQSASLSGAFRSAVSLRKRRTSSR